ncbi:hypothetical protein BGZ60DRAFT_421767 [Tricladium varicosporioides]|nr:hypothetical protein BGZ60DRAFT_421767 [Hymenoscyphus varicosporioides]
MADDKAGWSHCTCTKRFKTNAAMLQHQRDSPRHIDTPQGKENNRCFIPFSGGSPTIVAPSLVPDQVMVTKEKRKKTGKKNMLKMGLGDGSTWKVNPNTGQTMNLLEDEDWALCDKDCGWCGHCNEGVWY